MTMLNVYAADARSPGYLRQLLMDVKGGIHSNTITPHFHQWTDSLDRKLIKQHQT